VMRRDLDESDLTQLSRVNQEMERRLKGMGYNALWDIVYADIKELAEDARISIRTAERMVGEARTLLGLDENEGHGKLG
jgi:hypothetical protein